MKHYNHNESVAVRQERKLQQANFSDTQVTVLNDLIEGLVTKKEFHEFRSETRERFARLESRLDNTATKEDVARLESRLDNTATSVARLESRLDDTATKEDVARLESRLDDTATKVARLENTMATKDVVAKIEANMVTKKDLDEKNFRMMLFLPLFTISIVSVFIAVAALVIKFIV